VAVQLIRLLVNDTSPGVIGAAAAAFSVVCPEKLPYWGSRFRKICELLPNVDEWGQIVLIDILLRYAIGRHGYPKGSMGASLTEEDARIEELAKEKRLKQKLEEQTALIGTDCGKEGGDSGSQITADFWAQESLDNKTYESSYEVEALLQCTLPLLGNHNSAVVMAAVGVHWLLTSFENLKKIVKPVMFLFRSSFESQYVVRN
jgi:AP-3 complex subunit beta